MVALFFNLVTTVVNMGLSSLRSFLTDLGYLIAEAFLFLPLGYSTTTVCSTSIILPVSLCFVFSRTGKSYNGKSLR